MGMKDVPVGGFWSISLYDQKGSFEKNSLNSHSVDNLTAEPNPDGSFTVKFGGCRGKIPNCKVFQERTCCRETPSGISRTGAETSEL